jgi:sucrose phosphorylase
MTKPLNKPTITNLLQNLYGNQSDFVYKKIEDLIAKYSSKIKTNEIPLSEKDIILITYGDSVQKKGNSHLQTLKQFVDIFCLPEINTTHILPFYPYTSDDGFSVKDYFAIDSNLGNWNDIASLANSNNLMFDAVVNHMSKSSQWFQSFLAEENGFKDFFLAVNSKEDLSMVVRPRALPLLTPFKNSKGLEQHVWTTFSDDQVDLNYETPEVFIAVLDVLLFYISKGAKFIRLDAIAFLWKKIGTTCIHLTETHLIIKLYKKVIKSLTDSVYLITETNVPHKENISYFGNGEDEADLVYNFTLAPLLVYSIMKGNVKVLSNWAKSLKLPSEKVCFFNFTASHDGIGMRPLQNIISNNEIAELAKRAEEHGGQVGYKNNEDGSQSPYELNCNYMDLLSHQTETNSLRVRKMMLTQSVMLAIPGIPGIYFHSLVGSRNYYKGVKESGIKRRINREKLNFEVLSDELKSPNSIRNSIYSSYKQLLNIRTNEIAFNPFGIAEYFNLENDKVLVIKRLHKNETIYTVHNFSNAVVEINALSKNVYDLLNKIKVTDNYWKIEPYNFNWFKQL